MHEKHMKNHHKTIEILRKGMVLEWFSMVFNGSPTGGPPGPHRGPLAFPGCRW